MSGRRRLRISAGVRRGLTIEAAAEIRPTAGRLREALFDIWTARVPGASFLDLFAGSGAVGIEAASRGAHRVLLVESEPVVYSLLERTLERADLPGVTALRATLPLALERPLPAADRFDLVFADPPYDFDGYPELLAAAAARLADGGELALERRWAATPPAPPPGLELTIHRRYGDSGLSIFAGS